MVCVQQLATPSRLAFILSVPAEHSPRVCSSSGPPDGARSAWHAAALSICWIHGLEGILV